MANRGISQRPCANESIRTATSRDRYRPRPEAAEYVGVVVLGAKLLTGLSVEFNEDGISVHTPLLSPLKEIVPEL
jgi:hypothetical protein